MIIPKECSGLAWNQKDLKDKVDQMRPVGGARSAAAYGPEVGPDYIQLAEIIWARSGSRLHSTGWNHMGIPLSRLHFKWPDYGPNICTMVPLMSILLDIHHVVSNILPGESSEIGFSFQRCQYGWPSGPPTNRNFRMNKTELELITLCDYFIYSLSKWSVALIS